MSQQNLLDLAKQGDVGAISTLINRNLNPKGITAKISKSANCLRIMLEAQAVPTQSGMVNYLQSGVGKLAIAEIDTLQIFGRQTGDEVPAWSQTVEINQPVVQPLELAQQPTQHSSQTQRSDLRPTDSSFTTPTYEYKPSTKPGRIFSISIGICGLLGGLIFFFAIPLLGWVFGGIVIFTSFAMLSNGISGKGIGILKGQCPYCGEAASKTESQKAFNCTSCTKRIVIRDRKFYRTD
jgi:DNA-directed RNA polymerase subunit RPC12/RpoP